jgi:hypothetical protein
MPKVLPYLQKLLIRSCICISLLLNWSTAFCQQTISDSATYVQAVNSLTNLYKNHSGENSRLFSAPEYLYTTQRATGFPFWYADTMLTGTVYYDNNRYDNVPMQYDIVNQKIVIQTFDKNALLKLTDEKLTYFNIKNHLFVNINAEKNNYENITSGYYEQLYSNDIIIWAKRGKEFKLALKAEDQTGSYRAFDKYYIQQGNIFYPVVEKGDVLRVLKDKKAELNKFIKDNDIKFTGDIDTALINIAAHYCQLKK